MKQLLVRNAPWVGALSLPMLALPLLVFGQAMISPAVIDSISSQLGALSAQLGAVIQEYRQDQLALENDARVIEGLVTRVQLLRQLPMTTQGERLDVLVRLQPIASDAAAVKTHLDRISYKRAVQAVTIEKIAAVIQRLVLLLS